MYSPLFWVSLYGSLAIFFAGVGWRLLSWFRTDVGPQDGSFTPASRVAATARGLANTIFSRRLFTLLRVLFFEVLLQTRILRQDRLRWVMHIVIFLGFLALLLMHALGGLITKGLFDGYVSTLNPYLVLRDLFGALLLLGIVMASWRRFRFRAPRLFSNASDWLALATLALITLSGVALAGAKILSPSVFEDMVQENAPMLEGADQAALELYWAREFGVAFPGPVPAADPEALDTGRRVHEENCSSCHSSPKTAFLSFGASRLLKPFVRELERHRVKTGLWYLHFLSCFLGLALVPFGKIFHALSSPLSLLATGTALTAVGDTPGQATRRALALDACTHCGACSEHCSVRPLFEKIRNLKVLPSEKLLALRGSRAKGLSTAASLEALSEGSYLCTLCHRCTDICPVGLDLQDLWLATRNNLSARGHPEPHVWIREADAATWSDRARIVGDGAPQKAAHGRVSLTEASDKFSACVQCQTCTNFCPVVACGEGPGQGPGPDLTPQQIMNLLRLGLKELTLGSSMVWSCVTCYLCQEHCPEGIPVADILYELRSLAYQRLRKYRLRETARLAVPGGRFAEHSEGLER